MNHAPLHDIVSHIVSNAVRGALRHTFPTAPTVAIAALLAGALWAQPALAHSKNPGAHQHGVAKLALALDGETLELTLESPLDNVLGFERAPRTDRERQAVRQMAQRFHSGELFTPTPAAQCTVIGAELASTALDPVLLAPAPAATTTATTAAPAASKSTDDGHADLEATVRYRCRQPDALKAVDVGLFKTFTRMRQIDAAVVTGSAQRGMRLTRQQTQISW
jgi:hypothetical protein